MSTQDDLIEVTRENFGELLIESLHEALAIERGEQEPARRVRRVATAREAVVDPPRDYGAEEVQDPRTTGVVAICLRPGAELESGDGEGLRAGEARA